MLIMLNIVLLLAANIWVAIMRRKEKKNQNETGSGSALVVAIIVLSIVDVLFIGVIVLLACLSTTHWYTRIFIIVIGLLTEGFLVGVMTQWMTGRRLLAWCGCAVMAIGGLAGCIRYDQYLILYRNPLTIEPLHPLRRTAWCRKRTMRRHCVSTMLRPSRAWTGPPRSILFMLRLPKPHIPLPWQNWSHGRYRKSCPVRQQAMLTGK